MAYPTDEYVSGNLLRRSYTPDTDTPLSNTCDNETGNPCFIGRPYISATWVWSAIDGIDVDDVDQAAWFIATKPDSGVIP
jgi:hypothetical protein